MKNQRVKLLERSVLFKLPYSIYCCFNFIGVTALMLTTLTVGYYTTATCDQILLRHRENRERA